MIDIVGYASLDLTREVVNLDGVFVLIVKDGVLLFIFFCNWLLLWFSFVLFRWWIERFLCKILFWCVACSFFWSFNMERGRFGSCCSLLSSSSRASTTPSTYVIPSGIMNSKPEADWSDYFGEIDRHAPGSRFWQNLGVYVYDRAY